VGATAALEALCRRFKGFGTEHAVPEQIAALGALAGIGGSEAARAVRRIIVERIVQGPGLISALEAAAELGVGLPGNIVVSLLRHEAPSAAVIDSISAVADEECLVILGRIARMRPDLADAALAALDSVGSSRAVKIAAASRRLPPS